MALTEQQKIQIITLHQADKERREIADLTKVSVRSINRVLRKFRLEGTIKRKEGSGRPKKMDERDVRGLVNAVTKNRRATLGEISNMLAVEVSQSTIRRRLHEEGYNSRVAKKKPYLTDIHKKRRLASAKMYKNWTIDDWKKVVWTDEASFEKGKNSRLVRVWRLADEANKMQCLASTFKSDRASVMVWGAIRYDSKSELVIMDKHRRTAKDFVDQVYEGPLRRFWTDELGLILMEDGAPVHRSNAPKKWREDNNIAKLDWPAQSPDLNPIVNIWKQMKDGVQKRFKLHMKDDDFKALLVDVWDSLDQTAWNKLIASMPERIKAVIDAKGGSTRW
jgi:transposase